jgi:hypothetical protein
MLSSFDKAKLKVLFTVKMFGSISILSKASQCMRLKLYLGIHNQEIYLQDLPLLFVLVT